VLFNSLQYLLFLPVVVAVYWAAPKQMRPLLLVIASYFFYMSWMASYGLLLAGLTAWNFIFGILLASAITKHKRLIFIAGAAGNLACLALYKYTNFLIDSLWSAVHSLTGIAHITPPAALQGQAPLLDIILPLGISFFVFEFIHYLVDIYKGENAIKNPVRFALFASFFPSQIAGPIKRFQDFDAQVVEQKPYDRALFRTGIFLILEGMFKKVVLGDNLALLVQPGFEAPLAMGTIDAWVCVIAFTLQIYYDFSGYTDIGRGSAMLLGYHLPENFNMPYIAKNLSDFWHRWHISLSTWLRDYLYIPLGGSKSGKAKQARNLVMTMLLGGLWHGASWHYVVWGAFHGIGLVVTHTWQRLAEKIPGLSSVRSTFAYDLSGRLFTLFLVMMGWVVFRAENMPQACGVYQALFTWRPSADIDTSVTTLWWQSTLPIALMLYAGYHSIRRISKRAESQATSTETPDSTELQTAPDEHNWRTIRWWLTPPKLAQALMVAGVGMLIIGFAPHKAMPFIYFQF
jgi:alginate O-acetyltransferase complex protein AlgI